MCYVAFYKGSVVEGYHCVSENATESDFEVFAELAERIVGVHDGTYCPYCGEPVERYDFNDAEYSEFAREREERMCSDE